MQHLHSIAFTHRNLPVEQIGKFHLNPETAREELTAFKAKFGLDEMMYLSTCNRVEIIVVSSESVGDRLGEMIDFLAPGLSASERALASDHAEQHTGDACAEHLMRVASSLESMVIGEREIITQVRQAFERCRDWELTGDRIRLLVRKTIETGKKVFTETDIFKKPVSVVSLAYHRLRELNIPLDARIVVVGTGQTNRTLTKFLHKHGYSNFTFFNRTHARALALAAETRGQALAWAELPNFSGGFDVLVTCTSSPEHIITPQLYQHLLQGCSSAKVVIDLAIPADLHPSIPGQHTVRLIDVKQLKTTAEANLRDRSREISRCEAIIEEAMHAYRELQRIRQIERAMSVIPGAVKEIRQTATEHVFAKDLDKLDEDARRLLDKMMDYLEKKYISVPMKMAREVMLNNK